MDRAAMRKMPSIAGMHHGVAHNAPTLLKTLSARMLNLEEKSHSSTLFRENAEIAVNFSMNNISGESNKHGAELPPTQGTAGGGYDLKTISSGKGRAKL